MQLSHRNPAARHGQDVGRDTAAGPRRINTAASGEAPAPAYLNARGDGYDVIPDCMRGRPR
ncbi:hypothetical protein GCM10027161_73110 [Microbispora hainanensis]